MQDNLWDDFIKGVSEGGEQKCQQVIRHLRRWRETNTFQVRMAKCTIEPDGTVDFETHKRETKTVEIHVPFPDLNNYDCNALRTQFDEECKGCVFMTRDYVQTHAKTLCKEGQTVVKMYESSNGYVKNALNKLEKFLQQRPMKRRFEGVAAHHALERAAKRQNSCTYRSGGYVNIDREIETATLRFLEAVKNAEHLTHVVAERAGGTGELVFSDGGRPDLVSFYKGRPVIIAESKCTTVKDGYKVLQYAQRAKKELHGWNEDACWLLILMDKAPSNFSEVKDAEEMGIRVFWPGVDPASLGVDPASLCVEAPFF